MSPWTYIGLFLKYFPEIKKFLESAYSLGKEGITDIQINTIHKKIDKAMENKDAQSSAAELDDIFR